MAGNQYTHLLENWINVFISYYSLSYKIANYHNNYFTYLAQCCQLYCRLFNLLSRNVNFDDISIISDVNKLL